MEYRGDTGDPYVDPETGILKNLAGITMLKTLLPELTDSMKNLPIFLTTLTLATAQDLSTTSLILDLDAAHGLTLEDNDKVSIWCNQIESSPAKDFIKRDEGRKEAGSGRPTVRKNIATLNKHPALVFRQQELVCLDEDFFDSLSTGKGHTWITVIAVHEQQVGLKDVNSFFGNLRNGGKYEGIWACVYDDNTLWWGARNGLTFGRFDKNNPQLLGPKLQPNKFYIIAGRMAAGMGEVKLELFVDQPTAIASVTFPVDPKANPSRMSIGQERDAIQHPGHESFDGEIARFLIWDKPLDDEALKNAMSVLRKKYFSQ